MFHESNIVMEMPHISSDRLVPRRERALRRKFKAGVMKAARQTSKSSSLIARWVYNYVG